MAENETKPTRVKFENFIESVEPDLRRKDAKALDAPFRRVADADLAFVEELVRVNWEVMNRTYPE